MIIVILITFFNENRDNADYSVLQKDDFHSEPDFITSTLIANESHNTTKTKIS